MRAHALLALPALTLAACVHYPELLPAPGAQVVPGQPNTVAQESGGVRISVATKAWSESPSNLADVLTPILVAVENNSGRNLRIQYPDFQLVGSSGFRYAALPPFSVQGQSPTPPGSAPPPRPTPDAPAPNQNPNPPPNPSIQKPNPESALLQIEPAFAVGGSPRIERARYHGTGVYRSGVRPRFYYHRFYPAPYYGHIYGGFWGWPYWPYYWYWDPYYYPYYYPYWTEPLPSQDMMERALPEGVIDSGGRVSGFLYFQHVTSREAQVSFEMKLVDAKTNEIFGRVTIPFVVR